MSYDVDNRGYGRDRDPNRRDRDRNREEDRYRDPRDRDRERGGGGGGAAEKDRRNYGGNRGGNRRNFRGDEGGYNKNRGNYSRGNNRDRRDRDRDRGDRDRDRDRDRDKNHRSKNQNRQPADKSKETSQKQPTPPKHQLPKDQPLDDNYDKFNEDTFGENAVDDYDWNKMHDGQLESEFFGGPVHLNEDQNNFFNLLNGGEKGGLDRNAGADISGNGMVDSAILTLQASNGRETGTENSGNKSPKKAKKDKKKKHKKDKKEKSSSRKNSKLTSPTLGENLDPDFDFEAMNQQFSGMDHYPMETMEMDLKPENFNNFINLGDSDRSDDDLPDFNRQNSPDLDFLQVRRSEEEIRKLVPEVGNLFWEDRNSQNSQKHRQTSGQLREDSWNNLGRLTSDEMETNGPDYGRNQRPEMADPRRHQPESRQPDEKFNQMTQSVPNNSNSYPYDPAIVNSQRSTQSMRTTPPTILDPSVMTGE